MIKRQIHFKDYDLALPKMQKIEVKYIVNTKLNPNYALEKNH
jgi:hypothetical protein